MYHYLLFYFRKMAEYLASIFGTEKDKYVAATDHLHDIRIDFVNLCGKRDD